MADITRIIKKQLFTFMDKAGKATYAGTKEEPDLDPSLKLGSFVELEYKEGDFSYKDTYTGHYRSRGMETVRYKGIPIWASGYGGGMVKGKENLDDNTFKFLKRALSADEKGFHSFRGPHAFSEGDWKYKYKQDGDEFEFSGYEEIYYKGELVFFHRIIGGIIEHAQKIVSFD